MFERLQFHEYIKIWTKCEGGNQTYTHQLCPDMALQIQNRYSNLTNYDVDTTCPLRHSLQDMNKIMSKW